MFSSLSNAGFKMLQVSLCLGKTGILGHIISTEGVAPNHSKIEAMLQWPVPQTIKQLHGFLGLTGYYRHFIQSYASIAHALTKLLKKDSFIWSNDAQLAFDNIKSAMTRAPVPRLPDFTKSFVLRTDASGPGMGAVIHPYNHPIAFFSKKFYPKLINASIYVLELNAITIVVQKERHYLLGRHFIIETNQKSLKELMNQGIKTPYQCYYLSKLLGYDYEIRYKSIKDNKAVPFAFPPPPPDSILFILSVVSFDFFFKSV